MKTLGTALVAGAAAVALFQWAQIAYRLHLFFGECRGERAVNHIGDGDFALIYIANAILLASALFALRVLWQSRPWRVSSVAVGIVNGLGWLSLFIMHQTGALVEYGEFIRHMKGQV
jgi:hypothetical protein